jgi:hypothetical protein
VGCFEKKTPRRGTDAGQGARFVVRSRANEHVLIAMARMTQFDINAEALRPGVSPLLSVEAADLTFAST